MIKSTNFILILFISLSALSQKSIPGEYQTNLGAYGMFGEKLQLNCDGTMFLNFSGDLMNDTSFGKWEKIHNILLLKFDTSKSSKHRFNDTIKLQIRANGLFQVCMTKAEYNILKARIIESKNDSIKNYKLPNYSFFKYGCRTVLKDSYSSRTSRQYFVRRKPYDCSG